MRSREKLTTNLSNKQLTQLSKKETLAIGKNMDNYESVEADESKYNQDLLQIKTPMDIDATNSKQLSQTLKIAS